MLFDPLSLFEQFMQSCSLLVLGELEVPRQEAPLPTSVVWTVGDRGYLRGIGEADAMYRKSRAKRGSFAST